MNSGDRHDDLPPVRRRSVFKQVKALPGTQRQAAIDDGYGEFRCRQHRSHMGRHVVRALCIMTEQRVTVGHQARQERFQVPVYLGIRILGYWDPPVPLSTSALHSQRSVLQGGGRETVVSLRPSPTTPQAGR